MGWVALITVLLQVFGPLLSDLLRKWLEKRLVEAAAALPHPTAYGSEGEARDALFDKAIRVTWNPFRRFLLRRLKKHAAALPVTVSGVLPVQVPYEVREELAEMSAELDAEQQA